MVGLYAAFIMSLITALIGGRSGMISGATGAMAVVMVSLVIEQGIGAFTDLAFCCVCWCYRICFGVCMATRKTHQH